MKFTTEIIEGVRVVQLQGHFTGGPDTDTLRAAFLGWLEGGERSFVLDLEGVELLNSIGLGGIVANYTSCARQGATLKLSGLSERNRRAAYVSRILDLFEEYPNVQAAVASFSAEAGA